MLTAEVTPSTSVPNVVIGVTPSPSSVSEIPSALTKSEAGAAVQLELPVTPSSPPVAVARDTLMAPTMPLSDRDGVDEDDGEADEREPASEQRVRVAEKVAQKTEEPIAESKPTFSDTLIDAHKIEIVKASPSEPMHDDTLVDAKRPVITAIEEPVKTEASPKPNFEKTLPFGSVSPDEPKPVAEAAPAPVAQAKELPLAPTVDEETIPPAGDLAVAEQFFSEGDVSRLAPSSSDDLDDEIENDKAQRKSDPAVVKRRAKLARYVTWAVGVSAALCLIAGVRTAFTSSSKTIAAANAANAKSEVVVPKASPPPAVVAAPKPAEPAAAPAAAEAPKPVVTGDIKEEKAKAKAALNKNQLADAIEAGERAVAIDETDSEAWLLLAASYHQKGDLKEAQRAYHACLDKGTKDKFQRECRLFAR